MSPLLLKSGVQHDGVGVISMICILFMRAGVTPIVVKLREQGFRRLPLAASSLGFIGPPGPILAAYLPLNTRWPLFGDGGIDNYHCFGSLIKCNL
jgi:hypothetical protein